jgi:hypothetical protein
MHLVYLSHSYRDKDVPFFRYFGNLIRAEGLVPILDPPSESVNAARLQRHLRDSDGMIVLLSRRDDSVSPHILFEAIMCLQARKPILVFVEDTVSVEPLPPRLLRSRFSRKWYFRQVRDHRQALQLFRTYLGAEPPPRYQPASSRLRCLVAGAELHGKGTVEALADVIGGEGYELVVDHGDHRHQQGGVALSEHLSCADLAVTLVDGQAPTDQFLMGAIRSAFIPTIAFTQNPGRHSDPAIPEVYHPAATNVGDLTRFRQDLRRQLALFEQAFVELDTHDDVQTYTDLLIRTSGPPGSYDRNIRNIFVQELSMGDKYKVGQAMAVGPNAQASHGRFQQVWNEIDSTTELAQLAAELAKLRGALREEPTTAERDATIGAIAQAEIAAAAEDGPGALAHLRNAGKWALSVAEKIGVSIAAGAIKTALGL